eukprot:3744318-Pyramimonas_sp.AAC.1
MTDYLVLRRLAQIYIVLAFSCTYRALAVQTAEGWVTSLAGKPYDEGFVDGAGTNARFKQPKGLAMTHDGSTIYVADWGNRAIRSIDVVGGSLPPSVLQNNALICTFSALC